MRCTRLLALSTEKVKPTGNFGCPRCGQSDARSRRTDNRYRDANFHTGRIAERRSHAASGWCRALAVWKLAGRRTPPATGLFESHTSWVAVAPVRVLKLLPDASVGYAPVACAETGPKARSRKLPD
jgi:hypothetical protein